MLGLIALIILVLGAILIFAEMRPGEFEFQRNIVIEAAPGMVFALIDDFHNWPSWHPIDREDPALRRDYAGAERGKGAVSAWTGKSNTGRSEVIESAPFSMIMVKVDFTKPFKAHNVNVFTFAPAHAGTSITWTLRGTFPLLAKLMSLVVDMDKMMGKHLEDGLRNLKDAAEGRLLQQPASG